MKPASLAHPGGFTLVELAIVIAILALLGVGIYVFTDVGGRGKSVTLLNFMQQTGGALQRMKADSGCHTQRLAGQIEGLVVETQIEEEDRFNRECAGGFPGLVEALPEAARTHGAFEALFRITLPEAGPAHFAKRQGHQIGIANGLRLAVDRAELDQSLLAKPGAQQVRTSLEALGSGEFDLRHSSPLSCARSTLAAILSTVH